jgi:hypothetical protein
VLVAGARRPAASATGARQPKDRMVVRKRRDGHCPALPCSGANSGRLDEAPPASAYARQFTPLNQPPDRGAGDAQRSSRLFYGDHDLSHTQSY